ncbi:MAG: C25 family cysteine peptidase, partial [Planctomycetota bacterium]
MLNYRGHGSQLAWTGWGSGQYFTVTEINQLTNVDRYFVHHDVCCDNMDFPGYNGDCFSESMMKAVAGAVATDGAIIPSYTIPNHDYDKEFYKAVYDLGISSYGYSINYANITVYQVHGSIGQSNIRTYVNLGDGCLDMWTNTMQTMTVSHPNIFFIGNNTITVTTGMEGTLVCAQNNEVYAAGYTDATGSITLEFTPGPVLPGTMTITASAHNYLTYQGNIPVQAAAGPYVVYNDCDINDMIVGNNNGQWDFGETTDLSIEVKNVGVDPAPNTTVTIATPDPLITVIDGSQYYGTVNAGDSLTIANGFRVEADPSVPDQHMVAFTLTATSGASSWESLFSLPVNSPDVVTSGLVILDPLGNNNGQLDPGEDTDFELTLSNDGHADAGNVEAVLSADSPDITINGNPGTYGTLVPTATGMYSYNVIADAGIQSGTIITFTMDITADGGYVGTQEFELLVGDERNIPSGPDNHGYLGW